MSQNAKKLAVRLLIYGVAIVLLLVFANLAKSGKGIPCFFNRNFDILCPGCGATRALFALFSGEFSAAVEYHPVYALAVYPIIVVLLLQDLAVSLYRVIRKVETVSIVEFITKGHTKDGIAN